MLSSVTFEFINDFFPFLANILRQLTEYFELDLISCQSKEQILVVLHTSIRNPTLLPLQLSGLFIGLIGAAIMSRRPMKSSSWFWALLFFSGMNFTSIFCHNLLSKYSIEWKYFRLLDIVFTGSSALSLCLVPLDVVSFLHPLLFFSLLVINYQLDFIGELALVPEMTYIGTMIAASLVLLPRLHRLGTSLIGFVISAFGILFLLAGLIVDSYLCQNTWTSFGAVHLIFLGSNCALLGLLTLVQVENGDLKKKLH
jgi:hypothetical protein